MAKMTVLQLKQLLEDADNDRIIAIERPDENRSDERYLDPTGGVDVDRADEYFVIYTN